MVEDNDKELSPEDLKLLVEFFTLLAEWDTTEKKKTQMNSQQENTSLEASLNLLRS